MSSLCGASHIKRAWATRAAIADRYDALLSTCSMMQPMPPDRLVALKAAEESEREWFQAWAGGEA